MKLSHNHCIQVQNRVPTFVENRSSQGITLKRRVPADLRCVEGMPPFPICGGNGRRDRLLRE